MSGDEGTLLITRKYHLRSHHESGVDSSDSETFPNDLQLVFSDSSVLEKIDNVVRRKKGTMPALSFITGFC